MSRHLIVKGEEGFPLTLDLPLLVHSHRPGRDCWASSSNSNSRGRHGREEDLPRNCLLILQDNQPRLLTHGPRIVPLPLDRITSEEDCQRHHLPRPLILREGISPILHQTSHLKLQACPGTLYISKLQNKRMFCSYMYFISEVTSLVSPRPHLLTGCSMSHTHREAKLKVKGSMSVFHQPVKPSKGHAHHQPARPDGLLLSISSMSHAHQSPPTRPRPLDRVTGTSSSNSSSRHTHPLLKAS